VSGNKIDINVFVTDGVYCMAGAALYVKYTADRTSLTKIYLTDFKLGFNWLLKQN
jgi:hypothetical protein